MIKLILTSINRKISIVMLAFVLIFCITILFSCTSVDVDIDDDYNYDFVGTLNSGGLMNINIDTNSSTLQIENNIDETTNDFSLHDPTPELENSFSITGFDNQAYSGMMIPDYFFVMQYSYNGIPEQIFAISGTELPFAEPQYFQDFRLYKGGEMLDLPPPLGTVPNPGIDNEIIIYDNGYQNGMYLGLKEFDESSKIGGNYMLFLTVHYDHPENPPHLFKGFLHIKEDYLLNICFLGFIEVEAEISPYEGITYDVRHETGHFIMDIIPQKVVYLVGIVDESGLQEPGFEHTSVHFHGAGIFVNDDPNFSPPLP